MEAHQSGLHTYVSYMAHLHALYRPRGGSRPSASLPYSFNTPMFWSESDLKELEGTAVVGPSSMRLDISRALRVLLDKIGKEDAERDYNEKIVPVIEVGASPGYLDPVLSIATRVGPIYSLRMFASFITR